MNRKRLCAIALLLGCVSLIGDVAVLYSGFSGNERRFFPEFDKALDTIGVKAVKYENTKMEELTKDLRKYEMVLVTSCGNFENTVDLKPHADAWRDYLSDGGMVFVADANYASVLESFINRLGPEFELTPEHCIAHLKPSPENAKAYVRPHNLMNFPTNALEPLLRQGHWGHLTPKQPKTWDVIETCVENKPLTLAKNYGKGLLFVTVHSNLQAGEAIDFARNTIVNMLAEAKLKKHGLTLVSTETPMRRTNTRMVIRLKATGKTDSLAFSLKYTGKDGMVQAPVDKMVEGNVVQFTARIAYQTRGVIQFAAALMDGTNVLLESNWQDELPEILTSKLRRKHFYPGMNELEATLIAISDPPVVYPPSIIQWQLDGGKISKQKITQMTTTVKMPVRNLAVGKHVIAWELLQNGKSLAKLTQDFFVHPEPTMRFRDDGTLLINGKPFFPFGMYHVTQSATPEHRLDMVKEIAKYGYNLVHVRILSSEKGTDSYGKFLDECQKRGIYVITEFDYDALEVIRTYKNHPAVLGWNPGDEPYPKGVTPEMMFSRYDAFKQLDPNHIAYTVICTPSQYKNYACGTDVLAPDPYPIPNNPIDTLYTNYKNAHAEARKFDTALWAVPQCFGYGHGTWSRTPTADEYRAMLYLSLIAGAKGFVNYTYFDGGFFLPKSTELWEACKSVPTEMAPLIPFILNGKRTVQQENDKGVYAATWTLDDSKAIVIVNASPDTVLPFEIKGDFANASIHYGAVENLKAASAGLGGTLRPYGQAVFLTK